MINNVSEEVENNHAGPEHLEVLEYLRMHPVKLSKPISDLETLIRFESGL